MSPGLLPDQLSDKIMVDESGCWLWIAFRDADGYGRGRWKGTQGLAHRIVYRFLVGPVPNGLQLDHLCRVRPCVNPAHLEPVTRKTNILRGEGITAEHARKTHCKRGHAFDDENTYYLPRGGRECRACSRMLKAQWRDRQRAAKAAPFFFDQVEVS